MLVGFYQPLPQDTRTARMWGILENLQNNKTREKIMQELLILIKKYEYMHSLINNSTKFQKVRLHTPMGREFLLFDDNWPPIFKYSKYVC